MNILLVGVGGQGVILASEILSDAAMKAGFDVKKSEVHGMAQRGGSVNSHVVFDKEVTSPLIKKGDVDILLSFEELETLRYTEFLNKDSIILLNSQQILPPSVLIGQDKYPENIFELLSAKYKNTKKINSVDIAEKIGNLKVVNAVLLGVLSKFLDIKDKVWLDAISSIMPEKIQKINISAFKEGKKLI